MNDSYEDNAFMDEFDAPPSRPPAPIVMKAEKSKVAVIKNQNRLKEMSQKSRQHEDKDFDEWNQPSDNDGGSNNNPVFKNHKKSNSNSYQNDNQALKSHVLTTQEQEDYLHAISPKTKVVPKKKANRSPRNNDTSLGLND